MHACLHACMHHHYHARVFVQLRPLFTQRPADSGVGSYPTTSETIPRGEELVLPYWYASQETAQRRARHASLKPWQNRHHTGILPSRVILQSHRPTLLPRLASAKRSLLSVVMKSKECLGDCNIVSLVPFVFCHCSESTDSTL
ncbi:hypothetical protein IF1G_04227 [Cordyceps javanica]|uniref:Uncharacterized protein n=1 Tax=Cordyceps javanica TaxID=43265 RepID=A0A545V5J3_9HYPO|nr:hypothetical protein IF1G_04227 [Cordyceps javanica]